MIRESKNKTREGERARNCSVVDPRIRTDYLWTRTRIHILLLLSATLFFPGFFAYYFLNAHLHQSSKIKAKRSKK